MSSSVENNQGQLIACTISRDIQLFDLLIEDMDQTLGDAWGDLCFHDALVFLEQDDADGLDFVAIAIDSDDENNLAIVANLITLAKQKSIKVILITEDVSPSALHSLLREGGDEFVPYPLPEGELARAIERVMTPASAVPDMYMPQAAVEPEPQHKIDISKGLILPVQHISGGTGATTLAVNFANELSLLTPATPPRVCLLDFDFQFGATSTFLDLPKRDNVLEFLSDPSAFDDESFMQVLLPVGSNLHVLTAPPDMIPLDFVNSDDISSIIERAQKHFDYIVIDMPSALLEWTQTLLEKSYAFYAIMELDMRSAQNMLRLKRAMLSEELPFEKFQFVLNYAPGFTDLQGKSRVKRMNESLDMTFSVMLPDGGRPVEQASDQGIPLASAVPKNTLRKEIVKLAKQIHSDRLEYISTNS